MSARDNYFYNIYSDHQYPDHHSPYYQGYGQDEASLSIVECCEPTVSPLVLLGILAGIAALTVFFRQLGKKI